MVGKPHWLISRILKKWILTTFASVLVAFMESIFGGPYFDILEVLCFYFEPIYIFFKQLHSVISVQISLLKADFLDSLVGRRSA